MNIQARYPSERMNDANAKGILWFESRDSLGSILQTDTEYQTVVTEASTAHATGRPDSGQNNGTAPSNSSKKQ